MAKKDVQLVVRAKNEASGALNSVAQSLSKVNKELLEGVRSSQTASNGMAELGDDVTQLAKRLEGLRGIGQAATGLNAVQKSIAGMRDILSRTAQEFVTFSRQSREMQSALAGQREEARRLEQVLEAQTQAVREAREATLKRSDAVKELTRAENALRAAQDKKTQDAAEIAAATQRLEAARAVVERNTQAYEGLRAQQRETADALKALNGAIREQESELTRLENKRKQAIDGARQQKTLIDETVGSYNKLTEELRQTGQALGAAADDQEELARATKQAEEALERQQKVMDAMRRYSTGATGGFADPKTAAGLRAQREELEQVRQSWKALEADIRSQAEAMRGLAQPTEQQVRALQNTIAAARQAKAEFQALNTTLKASESTARAMASQFGQADDHVRRFNEEMRRVPNAPPTTPWQSFFRSIYGESRQAMSWLQRLRGEVIALGTTYVGLYGTINQVGGVINAYQQLEAAQNRLGVVFNQNGNAVRTELLWLERQAQRLGVEFGTLSDQYGKFAIAAQTANFSSEATREIFTAVAEAGRVAKLSNDQLRGTFLALEQMISKGKIQAEELRGQLGERLPGAVSILARALNVTTAELNKMMEDGEVLATESTMLAFAEELNRQFGPQLAASLNSTSANIGRFFNNIYQAQLRVARGGLIDGLNKALQELDKWFQSREGRDFFLSLGEAAGKALEILAQLPQHFDLIARAVQIIVALKLGSWFAGAVTSMNQMRTTTQVTATQLDAFRGRVAATVASLGQLRAANIVSAFTGIANGARQAASGFSMASAQATAYRASLTALASSMTFAARAAQTLWMAIGGWVGIVATGVSFLATELIGGWVGGVEEATRAIDEHERIMQSVLTAYDQVVDKTTNWQKGIENVNLSQAESNFIKQTELYEQALRDIDARLIQLRQGDSLFGRAISDAFSEEQIRKVRTLADEFKRIDKENIDEFTDAVVALNSEITDTDAKKLVLELLNMAQAALDAGGRVEEAAAVAKVMGSVLEDLGISADEAERIVAELTATTDENAESMDEGAGSVDNYKGALEELRAMIPGVAAEMKKLQQYSELDATSLRAAGEALRETGSIADALDLYGEARNAIDLEAMQPLTSALASASGSLEKSAVLLREFEGFRETPYWDVNAYRVGYGSDTVTLADGSIRKVVEGMRINRLDAERDLMRRIGEFQNVVRNQIGDQRFNSFTQDQQAALTSIAYNYGSLPDRIVGAVRTGSAAEIRQAILSLRGDNEGINSDRRTKEAFLFSPNGVNENEEIKVAQEALAAQERAAQLREQTLAAADRELAMTRLQALGDERRVAIREALNSAIDKGITDNATLWEIANKAGEQWDEENAQRIAAQQEATSQKIADLETEIGYQELINQGKERQAEIERAIAEARLENPNITQAEIDKIAELTARQYDLQNAETSRLSATEAAEQRINQLMEYRSTLQENLRMQMEMGDTAGAQQTQMALQAVNQELMQAINNAIQMWQAIGGPQADMAIAKLRQVQLQIQTTGNSMSSLGNRMSGFQGIAQNFAQGLMGLFQRLAQSIGQGEDAVEDMGRAFMEFAANFLIQIGQMIIQQALFNSMQGAGMGGGGFMGVFGGLFGMGHTGGLVGSTFIGSGNMTRSLRDFVPYFHDGGVVGLKPDETMAVLRKGEEVLTENDPRHIFNGGGMKVAGNAAPPSIKIVNSFDSADVVSEGLSSAVGEETLVNVVRRNASTFRDIINGS